MGVKRMNRALLVGVDTYQHFGDLSGCVNDVRALAPLLARNADEEESKNFECVALTGEVNRKRILSGIDTLLQPGAQVALLYFAGHGVGITNDVALASSDGDYTEPGVPLAQILGRAQSADIDQVIIILDCCHSGGAGGSPLLGANTAILRKGLAIVAASRHDQVSRESNGRGEFSLYLCGALDGGAADVLGRVTLAGVYAYIAECFGAFEQRPTFKANLEDAFEIRCTKPLVSRKSLRKLPEIFVSVTAEIQLDPLYERENPESIRRKDEPDVKRKRDHYDELTRYRNGKLIEFVDEEYLYWAAMNSKKTRLTAHGRYYWTLASKDLL
jgi:hypothetical protein